MADTTKIVFAAGAELIVSGQPAEVLDQLNRDERYHRLTTHAGTDVYIRAENVAYVERAPERAPMGSWRPL